MLAERKASPNQLAGWLDASLGTVAYHVRTLQQLGLIELVDETRVRGAVEHHYRAKARPNLTADGWAAAPPVARQAAVGSSLDVIGEYARVSAAAGGFDRADARLRRAVMRLDARGFTQLSKAVDKLLEQAEKIEASAAERIARIEARGCGRGRGRRDAVRGGPAVRQRDDGDKTARPAGPDAARRAALKARATRGIEGAAPGAKGEGRGAARGRAAPCARRRRRRDEERRPAMGSDIAGAGTVG